MAHLKSIAAGVLAISILTFGALFGRLPAFRLVILSSPEYARQVAEKNIGKAQQVCYIA